METYTKFGFLILPRQRAHDFGGVEAKEVVLMSVDSGVVGWHVASNAYPVRQSALNKTSTSATDP